MRKALGGFTLIELLVTISIVAIIAVIALPSFIRLQAQRQLSLSIQRLEERLIEARQNAVLTRNPSNVYLQQQGLNQRNSFFWSSGQEQTLNISQFSCEDHRWQSISLKSTNQVQFFPEGNFRLMRDGQALAYSVMQPIEFMLSNSDVSLVFELLPFGQVYLKSKSNQDTACN